MTIEAVKKVTLKPHKSRYLMLVSALLPPILLLFVGTENDIPKETMIWAALVLLGVTGTVSLWRGSAPVAWIKDDILYIRGHIFSSIAVDKKQIESMIYVNGEGDDHDYEKRDLVTHQIRVKLKGFEVWPIPINDRVEMQQDLRLYQFIKKHFYDLEYVKQKIT